MSEVKNATLIAIAGENAEDPSGSNAGRGDGDGGEHGRDHHARQQQARPGDGGTC